MNRFAGIRERISVTVMSLLILLTVAVTWSVVGLIRRNTFAEVSDLVRQESRTFKLLHQRRAAELLVRTRFLAAEPKIIAALGTPDIDRETVQFLADEIRGDGDLDFLLIRGRHPQAAAVSMKGIRPDAAAMAALKLPRLAGGYLVIDDKDVHAVSVPVSIGGMVVGSVSIGDFITDAHVRDLKPIISSEIILCVGPMEERMRVAATTLSRVSQTRIDAALAAVTSPGPAEVVLPPDRERFLFQSLALDDHLNGCFLKSLEPAEAAVNAVLKRAVVIAACFLILSFLAVKRLSEALTRPIRTLAEGTASIAAGNLDIRTDVRSPTEMRLLGQSFNKMAERIKDLLAAEERAKAGLEVRVVERTAELVESNRLLAAAHHDLKEQTAKRIQYEKLAGLGTLAAGIAHEINNPLTVVIGRSQALSESLNEPLAKKTAETISRAAARCGEIVKSILRFARQEGPRRMPVHVNLMIDLALETIQTREDFKSIRIVRDYRPDLPYVLMDEVLMQQAIFNVALNAFQCMRESRGRGTLTARTGVAGKKLRMSFADDGPGMTAEVAARIFDPFFTTKDVGQGSGLGMSVAHGIVEQHGGNIFVEKTGPAGTTVTLEVPLLTEIPFPEEEKQRAAGPRGVSIKDKRVLVVDDERDIRDLMKSFLEHQGCHVTCAESGEAALEALRGAGDYDILFVDVRMPGMDGSELYRQITARSGGLASRIVFVTGDTMSEETQRFLKDTGCESITKPFKMQLLAEMVGKVTQAAG